MFHCLYQTQLLISDLPALCGRSVKKQQYNDNLPSSYLTRMWANTQRDGHPAEHWWCPLFNAAKFG